MESFYDSFIYEREFLWIKYFELAGITAVHYFFKLKTIVLHLFFPDLSSSFKKKNQETWYQSNKSFFESDLMIHTFFKNHFSLFI